MKLFLLGLGLCVFTSLHAVTLEEPEATSSTNAPAAAGPTTSVPTETTAVTVDTSKTSVPDMFLLPANSEESRIVSNLGTVLKVFRGMLFVLGTCFFLSGTAEVVYGFRSRNHAWLRAGIKLLVGGTIMLFTPQLLQALFCLGTGA